MKKLFLIFIIVIIFLFPACSDFERKDDFKMEAFGSKVIIDNGALAGELSYNSSVDITLKLNYPKELEGVKITQGAFGITIQLDEANIREYQSDLTGVKTSCFEELFEILAFIDSQNLSPDKNGLICFDTENTEVKANFDFESGAIKHIETKAHKYSFDVKQQKQT